MAQAQETFTYNGTTPALQTIATIANSLAPADLNSRTGNTITINYDPANASLTKIDGLAVGAFADDAGTVSTNTLKLTNGHVDRFVYGGRSILGLATENHAIIEGGTVGGNVFGGWSKLAASKNTATVKGSALVAYNVHGGWSQNNQATENHAIIEGGTVGSEVYGGWSKLDASSKNTATVKGSASVGSHVYGGWSQNNQATENHAIIEGGTVHGSVFGGVGATGATHNTVSISGAPVFNTNAYNGTGLYGGDGGGNVRTGNTLQMRTKGVTVHSIENFEYLHFYLPASITNGDTVLTLTNAGGFWSATAGADITGSKVGVAVQNGASPALKKSDTVTLIHTIGGDLITDDNNLVNNVATMGTVSTLYEFALSTQDNNKLLATVTKAGINPQTKSFSEGRLGGLAFVNQGADMASGTGMERATAAAQAGSNAFGAISGGSSRYESGSHVDVKGFSLIAGATANLPNSAGKLMLGGFFEAGWGNYDSFNSFVDVADVNGKGDNRYYGAGVLAKQSFGDKFYAEGSVRPGKLENDFSGVVADTAVSYKMDKAYYGAHLGAGYVLPLGTGELDMYGKYLWTRQKGGNVVIAGDTFTFKDINSQRTRLGARYSYPLNTSTTLKLGAAWEYEFDAKAKASVLGFDVTAPEIKGSTAVLDAGIKVSPASNKNLSFEAGIQGYAGKRKGVTGNVAVKYAF